MKLLTELMQVSRRIGERFDLVQAGGGNTSIKEENKLYVKISGVRLSDVHLETHFAILDHLKLKENFYHTNWELFSKKEKEQTADKIVSESNLTPERRPSIETLLHAVCPEVVLHTHPYIVLQYFSYKEKKRDFETDFAFVNYQTPGIELTLELDKKRKEFIEKHNKEPEAIILQNHGLVVYDKTPNQAFQKTLMVIEKIQNSFQGANNLSVVYSVCNSISSTMEKIFQENFTTLFSNEIKKSNYLSSLPYFPDGVVFLGAGALLTSIQNLEKDILEYLEKYTIPPKLFIINNGVYITAKTFAKAREIEEVWNLHTSILENQNGLVTSLSDEEIYYLSHWEAEKYRQKV